MHQGEGSTLQRQREVAEVGPMLIGKLFPRPALGCGRVRVEGLDAYRLDGREVVVAGDGCVRV